MMHSGGSVGSVGNNTMMPGVQQQQYQVTMDRNRRTRGSSSNHDPGLYDLPSFYSPDYVVPRTDIPSIETSGEFRVRASTPFRGSSMEDKEDSGEESFSHGRPLATMDGDDANSRGSGNGGLYRNKCVSFLALVAGLAAFGCSLASLAGTTNWVDTWEPIDMPPIQDWPLLFGTGYGSLMPSRSKDGQSSSSSSSSKGNVKSSWSPSTSSTKASASGFANGQDLTATKSNWESSLRPPPPPPAPGGGHQHVPSTVENVTTTSPSLPSAVTTTTSRPPSDDEFDYDDDDYYAQDESYSKNGRVIDDDDDEESDEEIVMLRHEEEEQQNQEEDPHQEGNEAKRSLVVVFHVGLFRACPVLKGELPSSVVLPNLPCAPLEYINWRPLTGQSFRLWRNVEYTPDFLNKLRYATPCFMLGTFIGLVALIIAIGGRCTGPDRTLICSSLHILAGLSLGSGLIIFVSVLHEEFSIPSLRSSRHSGGWSSTSNRFYNGDVNIAAGPGSAFYSDSRSLLATATTAGIGQHSVASPGGGSGLVSAALIPSFRYGWSFYAALAAFVSSELAAAVYIILHTHIFKWASRTRAAAEAAANSSGKLLLSATNSLVGNNATTSSVSKEIGIQTSPLSSASLLMMMEKRSTEVSAISPTASAIVDVSHHNQQMHVPYCDLLTMDPGHSAAHGEFDRDTDVPPFLSASGRPSPIMYINNAESGPSVQQDMDCTCQIHYATYNRPKMRNTHHVAGIHRASTMPRKVAFAGEGLASVYQQTPL